MTKFKFNQASQEKKKPQQKAWVVFSGQADRPWLKILKPGFRHCFVLLHDGQSWAIVDPMLNRMDVSIQRDVPHDFDLPSWFAKRGYHVVSAPIYRDHSKPAPFMLLTCVEVVKRILGLHTLKILTPFQLYRYLKVNFSKTFISPPSSTKTSTHYYKETNHGKFSIPAAR